MDDVFHICNKKSIPVWCWHENKKKNLASILVYSEYGFHEEIWYLEANAEQQTTVNDLIEKK